MRNTVVVFRFLFVQVAQPVYSEPVYGLGAAVAQHGDFCVQCQRLSFAADSVAAALGTDGNLVEFPYHILPDYSVGADSALCVPEKAV